MIYEMLYEIFKSLMICLLIGVCITLILFFYENEKVKHAVKLYRMGKKDEAKKYYAFIDQYMEGGEV